MLTSSIIISAKYLCPTNHRGARFALSVAGDELPTKGRRILLPYGYANGTITTLENFLTEKGIPVQTIGTVKDGWWVIAVSRSDWEAVFTLFTNPQNA
jgi:hypothetical protein